METNVRICTPFSYPLSTVALNGFGMMGLCVFGLFGNCACLTVLIRTYLGTTTFKNYLSGLCLADTVTLVSCVFMMVIPVLASFAQAQEDVTSVVNQLTMIFYPIGCVAEHSSTLLLALISAVRFSAVFYPLKMRLINTSSFARATIAGVFLFACIFNIPRLLELNITPCVNVHTTGNNRTMLMLDVTSLRNSYTYKVSYMIITNGLVVFILPFLTIFGCNTAVAYKLCTENINLSNSGGRRHSGGSSSNEMTTKLLIFMSFFFLLCRSLPFAVNIIEAKSYVFELNSVKPDTYGTLVDVSNFLVAVKASSNFWFYMLFNQRFRQVIMRQHSN